jgi:hypothetical protein
MSLSRLALSAWTALALFAGCNEIAGIREGDPLGGPIRCEDDADCPAPAEPECATFLGCQGEICSYAHEIEGRVVSTQVPGDCARLECNGSGGVRLAVDDDDAEDGDPCTLDTCDGGLPSHTPMQELPCYEGPSGTQGVGMCVPGFQLCDANFQPIGGCEGQMLPADETCLTAGDDDCDGETNEEGEGCVCTPSITSPCYTGPAGTEGVGLCATGNQTCNETGTGYLASCTDVVPNPIDDCSIPGDDDCDGVSVSQCTGTAVWVKASKTTASTSSYKVTVSSVASDDENNLYAAGVANSNVTDVDLGGGPLTVGYSGRYVVKFAPNGDHLWSAMLSCSNSADGVYSLPRLALAGGGLVMAFVTSGLCSFDGVDLFSTSGLAIVRLDPTTGALVSHALLAGSSAYLYALAPAGSAVYLGGYSGAGTLGGTPISSGPFVAKVDGDNVVTWAESFPAANNPFYSWVRAMAVLPDGAVAFAGSLHDGTIDFGGGPLGSGHSHYFGVVESVGGLRWGRVFSGGGTNSSHGPQGLVAGPSSSLVALGQMPSSLQLDGYNLGGGYLAWLDPGSGAVTAAKVLMPSNYPLSTLSIDTLGHLVVGAALAAGSSIAGPAVSLYGRYFTKLDAGGNHLWTKWIPVDSPVMPIVAAGDGGVLFTAGNVNGVQTFDNTNVGTAAMKEVLFGRLAP